MAMILVQSVGGERAMSREGVAGQCFDWTVVGFVLWEGKWEWQVRKGRE